MVRKLTIGMSLVAILLMIGSVPVFAQEHEAAAPGGNGHWMWLVAGFSMAIASAVCGNAQGKATAAACEAIARNPSAAGQIRTSMIIGLALIESLALYVLVIVFAKIN